MSADRSRNAAGDNTIRKNGAGIPSRNKASAQGSAPSAEKDQGALATAGLSAFGVSQHGVGQTPIGAGQTPLRPAHLARRRVVSVLLWLALCGLAGLLALRYAPSWLTEGRKVPQVAAFIPWLTLPAVLLCAAAAATKRCVLVLLYGLLVAAQVVWHAGYFVPAANLPAAAQRQVVAERSADDNTLRLMTLNCMNGQADAAAIVRAVQSENVELLALQEVSEDLLARLKKAGIAEVLPHRLVGKAGTRDNGGVNCLFSLAPLDDETASALPAEAGASATPAATLELGNGTKVRFLSVHPSSPKTGERGLWNTSLVSLGQSVRADVQYVLLGDFNATWDHLRFRRLLGNAGLVDASQQAGEGFHMTYPSDPALSLRYAPVPVPFSVMEIDHILYPRNGSVAVAGLHTMKIPGTDHAALLGTLAAR